MLAGLRLETAHFQTMVRVGDVVEGRLLRELNTHHVSPPLHVRLCPETIAEAAETEAQIARGLGELLIDPEGGVARPRQQRREDTRSAAERVLSGNARWKRQVHPLPVAIVPRAELTDHHNRRQQQRQTARQILAQEGA